MVDSDVDREGMGICERVLWIFRVFYFLFF